MTALDADAARKAGVAVPPSSKEEYLESSSQLAPGFLASSDADEPSLGWTTQHQVGDREMGEEGDAEVKAYIAPGDTLPGQVYTAGQLPDPQAAINAGFAPQKIPAGYITDDADHIQGPEPSERAILEQRDVLRAKVVEHVESRYNDTGETTTATADVAKAPVVPPADPSASSGGAQKSSGPPAGGPGSPPPSP